MIVTLILSLILMASLFLMIWVAVSLVQNPKLFTTAPKDIQAAAVPHKERFPGARILGWFLLTKSHFFQHYYPETEGCVGYHQFGFNRKEQLTRIILFPLVSMLLA